jgi:DDE domain
VQRFTPLLSDAARVCQHAPGDRWFVDETYVKVGGVWRYVYRAIDQHGQVIDVLVSARRDADAARRFFTRALRTLRVTPSEVVTDASPVYPGVLDELIPPRGITSSSTHPTTQPRRSGPANRLTNIGASAPAGSGRCRGCVAHAEPAEPSIGPCHSKASSNLGAPLLAQSVMGRTIMVAQGRRPVRR